MPSLKARVEQLEGRTPNSNLAELTDEQLTARIAAFGVKADTPDELAGCIAKLKAEIAEELEQTHAEH